MIKWWYRLSAPLALVYAGGYVWLLVDGDSHARSFLLRWMALVSTPCVWVFPAVVASRTPVVILDQDGDPVTDEKK